MLIAAVSNLGIQFRQLEYTLSWKSLLYYFTPRVRFASFYFILCFCFYTMADFNQVAKAFVEFYYQTFDTGRQNLAPLYASILYNLGWMSNQELTSQRL